MSRAAALLALALSACSRDDHTVAAAEAIDHEVDHATHLALAACKPDHDGATSLRATTVAGAFSIALGAEAACASAPSCSAPASTTERAASVRELPADSRKILLDAGAAVKLALGASRGEPRARLGVALLASERAAGTALSLAKLCGNPARVSEVPEAMSRLDAARGASRAATKALRGGG